MKLILESKLREILTRYYDDLPYCKYPDEDLDEDIEKIAEWLIKQVFGESRVPGGDDV